MSCAAVAGALALLTSACRTTRPVAALPVEAAALCVGTTISSAHIDAAWTRLAIVDWADTVRVWDLRERRMLSRFSLDSAAPLNTGARHSFAFSPDGSLLANAGRDGNVRVWRVRDGRLLTVARHSSDTSTRAFPGARTTHFGRFPVMSVAFDPNGRWLVSTSLSGSVIVWSTDGWTPRDTVFALDTAGTFARVDDAILTDDGRTLMAVTYDGDLLLWETSRWHLLGRFDHLLAGMSGIDASRDGAWIALVSDLGELRTWSRDAQVMSPPQGNRTLGWRPMMAFLPDGTPVLGHYGDRGGTGYVQVGPSPGRTASYARRLLVLPRSGIVQLLSVAPDGQSIAVSGPGERYVYFLPLVQSSTMQDLEPGNLGSTCRGGSLVPLGRVR